MTVTDLTTTTSAGECERLLVAAHDAANAWGSKRPAERARVLDGIANAIDEAAGKLLPLAEEETNLSRGRLSSELQRTTFQLRLFGQQLRDGAYLRAIIDLPDPQWPMGAPRPDLRRTHVPIGPVVVFAASNFPFAFSVAGGDTASALAAGNPVLVKAHSGHPRLSAMTADVVTSVLEAAGAPEGVFGLLYGVEAGRTALADPRIKAGSFTGSIPGGRALMDIAVSRPDPIPFYGELGSNNPVFVTEQAAHQRPTEIAEGFVNSFSLGAGQFCTKPGTLFVPAGSDIVPRLEAAVLPAAAKLLNGRIAGGYQASLGELTSHPHVEVLAQGTESSPDAPSPTLLKTQARHLLEDPRVLESECFGPAALVIEYDDESQLVPLATTFEGQLTATIYAGDTCDVNNLVQVLREKAGRLLWNQWPTGVSVTYAQQHGGPYPATTSPGSTSVGTAAIERFLRPVAFQGFPRHLLPEELQDANPLGIPQTVNQPTQSA
ncbi:aldehyde dehydrogenase (NADP(+)) [Arthrobacter pigmenti]